MSGGETNETILDSNISKGDGHQSSPAHPRTLGRGDSTRLDTRTRNALKLYPTHTPSLKWQSHVMITTGHVGAEYERKVTNQLSGCVGAC
jgi:hypothetical protein